MSDVKSLGYRPSLTYTDEYSSDDAGIFQTITQEEDGSLTPETEDTTIGDLIDQMEVIDTLIDKIPGDASDIIGEVFEPVLDFIKEELYDKEVTSIPEEEDWSYEEQKNPPIVDDTPPIYEEPDIVDEEAMWNDIDPFPIKKEEYTKAEIIEKEYVKNLTDLFNDYAVNMHNTLSNFWTNIVTAVINKGTDEIDMLINNILLNSSSIKSDSLHLLDSAIRNQINRDMKLDYYANIFNAEESITHLKQFKAMYELRLRYANIEKKEGSTSVEQMNNNILEGMRITYDLKYDVAYENLLRYLKSSADVLDDTLKTWLIEIKSKQVLIERKGIK